MNVFDFDNTLYHGESSVDFAFFLMKRNRKLVFFLPVIFISFVKYKLCLIGKDRIESQINDFMKSALRNREEALALSKEFWKDSVKGLNVSLLKTVKKDDAILTAGVSFLFEAIRDMLGTSNIVCSEFNFEEGVIEYLNFGENKAKKYRELYGAKKIDCFYTDSYNDRSMMDISDSVFLVRKKGVKKIK